MGDLSKDDKWMLDTVNRAMKDYTGDATKLERAIGALFMARYMGWKWIYLAHSRATVRSYEGFLGITFKDEFPAEGEGMRRSVAWKVASTVKDFWQAARGQVPEARGPNITK
ncbi:MAG TPA: hypothetical protein VJ961_02800 [Mariprofundaceae bacterium]|nr:hypothetical protein [Mariprofundaceae bacterium]